MVHSWPFSGFVEVEGFEFHSLAHVMGIPEVTDDPKYPHIIWKRLRGPYDRALTEKPKFGSLGKMMLQKMVQRDV